MKELYKVVQEIKEDEGFEGDVYLDHLDNPTIGYGTLLPITEAEASLLLRYRLESKIEHFAELYKPFITLPVEAQLVLANMMYQLGVNGLLKFKRTLALLSEWEFEKASKEMLDSRWAKQTPNRAKRLSDRIKALQS